MILKLLLAAICFWPSVLLAEEAASYDPNAPRTVDLELIYVFDEGKTEYMFVVGQGGFKTVEKLQDYLSTLPKGSEVKWAPGCERFGDEPLLSNEKDMKAFQKFLKSKNLKFTLVPAG